MDAEFKFLSRSNNTWPSTRNSRDPFQLRYVCLKCVLDSYRFKEHKGELQLATRHFVYQIGISNADYYDRTNRD